MITATAWVRRGAAAPNPVKYQVDEDEMMRISKLAKDQLSDAKTSLGEAQNGNGNGKNHDDDENMNDEGNAPEPRSEEKKSKGSSKKGTKSTNSDTIDIHDEDLKEFDLEHYDSDPVDSDGEPATMFGNVQSLVYHAPGEKDPYLTLPENEKDFSDDEREELQIMPTDNLLLTGKLEDEVAHLEVYVYEDQAENFYVHHDIMLPGVPLCLEWLDFPVGGPAQAGRDSGNFVAIGTMEPDIEVWDLDVVDSLYPNAILGQGGQKSDASKKKKKKRSTKANDAYHVDSVLALAANSQHRNLLASGSADQTIKLWDLQTTQCARSYNDCHNDKVCALDWNPSEATVLLSGSYDRSVLAADLRIADTKNGSAKWKVSSDVESVKWNPHDSNYFFVTTDNGMVYYYDARNAPTSSSSSSLSKPVWMLQAHDSDIPAFDVNPRIPGFLATGSTDRTVKLWHVDPAKGPSMVVSRQIDDVGKVFNVEFAPDDAVAFRLSVGGSKGVARIWDTSTNPAVRRAFTDRLGNSTSENIQERMIGTNVDDEASDEDEEEQRETIGKENIGDLRGKGEDDDDDDEDDDEDEDDEDENEDDDDDEEDEDEHMDDDKP